jgi:hypothetical protein
MADIKIFAMNDCDWYAAATPEEAKRYMAENLSYESVEAMYADGVIEGEPCELSDADLDRLKFKDLGEDDSYDPDGEEQTFRARLAEMVAAGDEFPCFFASTEY